VAGGKVNEDAASTGAPTGKATLSISGVPKATVDRRCAPGISSPHPCMTNSALLVRLKACFDDIWPRSSVSRI